MWIWLYGLSITLHFWFFALKLNDYIVYAPLFAIGILNIGAVVQKSVLKDDASLLLAMLSSNILFTMLSYLQPQEIYYIFSIVFGIIVLLTVMYHSNTIFVAPPRWLSILNATSLILSVVIYVMLYATLQSHIDDFTVLLPFGVLIVLEIYATYRMYHGLETVTLEKCQHMARNRLTYTSALIIIFITTIVQTFDIISMNVNFGIASIIYMLLIVVRGATWMSRYCLQKPMHNYTTLKESSINEGGDV